MYERNRTRGKKRFLIREIADRAFFDKKALQRPFRNGTNVKRTDGEAVK
jgi:hypothetical protein